MVGFSTVTPLLGAAGFSAENWGVLCSLCLCTLHLPWLLLLFPLPWVPATARGVRVECAPKYTLLISLGWKTGVSCWLQTASLETSCSLGQHTPCVCAQAVYSVWGMQPSTLTSPGRFAVPNPRWPQWKGLFLPLWSSRAQEERSLKQAECHWISLL